MFIPPALRRIRHSMNRNTRRGSRRNIAAHYDLGNAFYSQWLDPGMMYSSGLYTEDRTSLIEAQQNKLDRVAALLNLSGGERVLEIGCGWGGLAEMLAERHGCTVTGLTLSSEQLAYACDRLARSPAQGQCEFRLQDYRDVVGTYDRIVSVEMLEAVGEAQRLLLRQIVKFGQPFVREGVIRVQQREPHVAQRVADVGVGDLAEAAEVAEDVLELAGQRIEHGADSGKRRENCQPFRGGGGWATQRSGRK